MTKLTILYQFQPLLLPPHNPPGCAMSNEAGKGRVGTKLFTDYQMLSRIWTHPWCLQLDYISKENRVSSTVRYTNMPHTQTTAFGVLIF